MLFPSSQKVIEALERLNTDSVFQAHVANIRKGRFARNPEQDSYQSRIVYTKKLRDYVYNPALLNVIFSDIELKTLFFKTFGYQGQMKFTLYPNAWLRDFPLLDFGENVYLGDGIILGTNQVSTDQQFITVGPIKIGANTIIDQRNAIAYGTTIGQNCGLRFDVVIGIKCVVGDNTVINERTTIAHGVKVGNNVTIGQCCKIGNMSIIEDGVKIDFSTVIPAYSKVSAEGIINYRTGEKVSHHSMHPQIN